MDLYGWTILILSAVTYFYFHWSYFLLLGKFSPQGRIKNGSLVVSFLLIYIMFNVCSILQLHLVINWTLFFLFLLVATLLLYGKKDSKRNLLHFALNGIFYGLFVNVFSRCVIALIINRPLSSFDNHIYADNNLKSIPIILGFFLSGLLLHQAAREKQVQQKKQLLSYPNQISFLNKLLIGLILYLDLNLLLYQTAGNELILKIWGIKSCFLCVVGYYLGERYALRMSELFSYREKTRRMQEELYQKEEEEKTLSQAVCRDALTGCYNRAHVDSVIKDLTESHTRFTLCFLDLNCLKYVNDHFSHEEGDKYLLTVAQIIREEFSRYQDFLFRYGGDEFLILLVGIDYLHVKERMELINLKLGQRKKEENIPFPMSVSYGIVESQERNSIKAVIHLADTRMYMNKLSVKEKKAKDVEKQWQQK